MLAVAEDAIRENLQTIKRGKVCGGNGIRIDLIMVAGEITEKKVLKLFNKCLRRGMIIINNGKS